MDEVAASSAPGVNSQTFEYSTLTTKDMYNSAPCGSIQVAAAGVVSPPGSGGAHVPAGGGEKRKRGRPRRQGVGVKPPPPKRQEVRRPTKAQPLKTLEEEEDVWEDVCFICFDGGSLVLCDRKGCSKAYHTTCIKRDEAYFQSEGEWYCGWHICSVCQRAAHYMCYTCTYALCKGCTKDTDFVCVRRNMGLCTTCMKTILLIENKDQENKELIQVDFDDKTSWEYLFKVYWIHLKQKISLTLHELTQAKNLSKGVGSVACNQKLHGPCSGVYGNGLITNGNSEQLNVQYPKDLEQPHSSGRIASNDASLIRCKEWASKKLLDFVAHVKNGDTSVLSQFEVQGLLLEYIKKNSLLDRDCQVVCDLRLTYLFGKPRVSQSEMLKLLECHFLLKEDLQNSSTPAGNVESPLSHLEHRENKESLIRLQNSFQKFEVGVPQDNLDEYAAIDVHNMNMIFLPGNLMGSLTQDEKFHDKVVGSIVRIKISDSDQKQDMYRLVQVTGTNKVPKPYNLGNKTVDVVLEVLNLDKKEYIAIDAISDQEFSPDECRHLREIIKCGLVKRLTVGEVRKKAMELLPVRLNERLDAEISKLNQLCDQTSEKERVNELRQRITKLQLLKTPEEYQRRFSGILQVHADPKMSPDYDSEQNAEGGDGQKPELYLKSKSSEFSGTGYNPQREDPVKDEGLINDQHKVNQNRDENDWRDQAVPRVGTENSAAVLETESSSPMNDSETEKLWYYRDPNDKTQGPFSIVQLREWSTTGYFPPDMRIWTIYEHQDSILLTDALNGQFHTAAHLLYNLSLQSHHVRGSNRNSDAESNEHTEELGRDGNQIVETLKEGGTGGNKCRESYESGCSDVLGDNNGVQSSENSKSGRTDVLDGTNGLQSRENSEYGKINDTGVQSIENNESRRSDVSGSVSYGFTASGFCSKQMQPGNSSPCESKEHDSSSDYCQIGQLPSSTSGSSHVSPRQGGVRESEGSRSSLKHEKLDSDVSAATQTDGQSHENKYHGKSKESQPMGQNRRSFPINLNSKDIDLNSGLSPATNSDSSKQSCEMEPPELPSCMLREGNREPKTDAAENSQLSLDVSPSGMPNPPSPMLKLSNESQIAQVTEYKLPSSLKAEYQDLRPSRSSASSLVVGGAQFQNIADDWGGYPPPPVKPVLEGWSSGLVSSSLSKQHDTSGINVSVTAHVEPLAHVSAFNHTPNTSSWHGIVEPIEFISLAEESVSDLLAEVDAMESQSGGFASPTSAMRCEDEMMKFCKNESFTIEDLSPTHNPGRNDAMSSTGDLQLLRQSTAMQELPGASEGNIYDPSKKSSKHSSNSRDREARFAEVRVNQRVPAHPGLSLTMSQDTNSAMPPTSMMEFLDSGIMGRDPEHMNLFRAAPSQGINNIVWATNQGASWGNPNLSLGAHNGNGGLQWDVQRRYAGERHPGPRDYANHGGDTGYGSSRISFNRPPFGGGGGYARSPKGQRVCKFYESGHCKKGASCGYLHP